MNKPLPKNLFQFIFYFLKPHPWAFAAVVLLSLISGSYGTIYSYLIKVIIDDLSLGLSAADLWQALLWPAIYFVLNYEVHNLSWRGIQYVRLSVGLRIQNQIIKNMFAYVEGNSFQFFQNNFSGTIASNISSLSENAFVMLTEISPFLVRQTMQTLLAVVTMWFVSPYFFLAFFLWIVFSSQLVSFSLKKRCNYLIVLRRSFREYQEK